MTEVLARRGRLRAQRFGGCEERLDEVLVHQGAPGAARAAKAGRRKVSFSPDHSEEPCWHLVFRQNSERINVCCWKPSNVWQFFMTAPGN
jgi:hypothetical protein